MRILISIGLTLGFSAAVAVGTPVLTGMDEGGSWYIRGYDTGYGGTAYDMFAIELVSGPSFELPTWRDMPGGFENVLPLNTPTTAVAAGPALTGWLGDSSHTWRIYFDDSFQAPTVFNWYTFGPDGEDPLAAYRITVSAWPDSWSVVELFGTGVHRSDFTAVPVPAAALLGAIGLGLVGWIKRRLA